MSNYIDLPLFSYLGEVVGWAKVSPEDWNHVSQFRWIRDGHGYARRTWVEGGKQWSVSLHVEIMGKKPGFVIDHKNQDKLDCRRRNLRFATKSQNAHNTQRKGVYYCKWRRRFFAHCRVDGKRHSLGGYATREEAEEAVVKFRQKMGLSVD